MALFKRFTRSVDPVIGHFTRVLQQKVNPLGITPDGMMFPPERTLAIILKEWARVRRMTLDDQISLLEWRVFSKNFWPGYPDFSTLNEWIMWRLRVEFPGHPFIAADGWTPEMLDWAKERASEFFV